MTVGAATDEDYPGDLDQLDADPFAFDEPINPPRMSENFDWDPKYDWGPQIKVIEEEGSSRRIIRGRKSDLSQALLWHLGRPMRLDNHAFMLPIYNSSDRHVVMKCSRQVAKTVRTNSLISMADGSLRLAKDVVLGDRVATMADDGRTMTDSIVTWVSHLYEKPCLRITSRQGHVLEVAETHPIRVWNGWKKAGQITLDDRIAAVRRCGSFGNTYVRPERIRLTAYLIGDGYIDKTISFTSMPGIALDEFVADVTAVGGSGRTYKKSGTKALQFTVHVGPVHEWMREDGLSGSRSATKFLPGWVFSLPREQAAMFLNRLWSTDGHVKRKGSRYDIGYGSISKRLARDVQALLWKFGIPSKIRSHAPKAYVGTDKRAYSLRVETADGARAFLSQVGAIGKSDLVTESDSEDNNNRDTFPVEAVEPLIKQIAASRNQSTRLGCKASRYSLRSAGLMEKLQYPPTRSTIRQYVSFFRGHAEYDQSLVSELEQLVDTDLFWDRPATIEPIGTQECVDFEIEGTHNFVTDGIVTHNSSTIAFLMALDSITNNHWRSLYVSPSALQTRQFSNEKLRPTLYDSPYIVKHFVDKNTTDQVFEKTLANGSYMFLRYAFLTAARARGIPANKLYFDEVQDLLKDNIKVISQSMSASRLSAGVAGAELLAGTPLTFSNTLEEYWRESTQCEWLVPCDCKSPRYWNVLDQRNIGKKGLICSACGKPIDSTHGQWVSFSPDEFFQGYHITQLMVPWKQSEEAWKEDIVYPSLKWPEAKFNNEILGVAFDNASAPVTKLEIQECCYPRQRVGGNAFDATDFMLKPMPILGGLRVFGGIDWGEGRSEGEVQGGRKKFASWTVLTLGAYVTQDLFWPFLMKRYVGQEIDPEKILPDVLNICEQFRVDVLGADWGHGWGVNSRLFQARGRDRVMQFAYSSNLGARKKFDKEAYKYIINRNAAMSGVFAGIKDKKFIFPSWSYFEPFAKDILAEYVEYNETTHTMKFDHPIDQPDDALHSLVYCKLAADISGGRF